MNAQRAKILLAGATALLLVPHTAQAQVSEGIVLNILRECAKIDDPSARLACFDNNIGSAGAAPRSSAPAAAAAAPVPQSGGAPVASSTPQGFGAESVRTVRRQEAAQERATAGAVRARVASVTPREPGVYLVTLEGGARWQFNEGVASSYRVPEPGSTVEIERASLGSYLLRFNSQPPVPVRRIQ